VTKAERFEKVAGSHKTEVMSNLSKAARVRICVFFSNLIQTKSDRRNDRREKKTKPASQPLGVSSSVALEALGDFESNVVQTKEKKKRRHPAPYHINAKKSHE
jgi:hypothetical protein